MIYKETLEYTLNGARQSLPGFDSKYHNIVDYILKITEDIWEKRAIWVIHKTYEENVVIHVGAQILRGLDAVVDGTIKKLSSFPDRKMGGEAIIWSGDSKGHFYSSHRIFSTATNTGDTEYGKATQRKISFRTIADCAIAENKIYEEWLVRDNLTIIEQLGFDPVNLAKKNNRYDGKSSLAYKINHLPVNGEMEQFDMSKDEEMILSLFYAGWDKRNYKEFRKYYKNDSIVHAIGNKDFTPQQNSDFIKSILDSFPNAVVSVERITSNKKGKQTELAARWKITGTHDGKGFFAEATGVPVMFRGISHFLIQDGLVVEEWTIFDAFDVLCQIHADTGAQGYHSDENGINKNTTLKRKVVSFIKDLNHATGDRKKIAKILKENLTEDVILNITKPYSEITGIDGFADKFWLPLVDSFPDIEIQPYILIGGENEGKNIVDVTGNFIGTFKRDWLGIPACHQKINIRFTAHYLFENNLIKQAWYFLDMLDVMRQAGFEFFTSKGDEGMAMAPMTCDGIVISSSAAVESKKSFELTNAMINGLLDYDEKTLDSMKQERFWDVQNMMWYGPSGIGTTKGLKEFQEKHQIPFLQAFPNRGVVKDNSLTNYSNIADGNYTCHFGFPIMNGKHTGDGWLGLRATNKEFTMRVMDFWRREDDNLKENWVFIDMIDVLLQFGVDVFELLKMKKKLNIEQHIKNIHLQNKRQVLDFIREMHEPNSHSLVVLKKFVSEQIIVNITKPFREVKGIKDFNETFWMPMQQAFPDLENQTYILVGGEYEGRDYVSCTGNLIGTFKNDWLGIPCNNQPIWIRYASHFLMEEGKIAKAWYFIDVIDVLRQIGFHFFPNRGIEWIPPPPMTGDGLVIYVTDENESKKSLDLTNAMLTGLGSYDGKTLESMGQELFWDVRNMMWYGPSGIGTTRGLKGFQKNHQVPFISAFPDRGITQKIGEDYFTQIGDGNYSCDFGFPSMYGTHTGDGWLGLKATGKKITLRVVDYWRRDGEILKENWVMIDMVDVLEQLGIDIFDLLKKQINNDNFNNRTINKAANPV